MFSPNYIMYFIFGIATTDGHSDLKERPIFFIIYRGFKYGLLDFQESCGCFCNIYLHIDFMCHLINNYKYEIFKQNINV